VLVITNIKTARVRSIFSPYCPPPFHSSLAIYVSTSLPLFSRKEHRPNTGKKWLIGESFLPRFGHYKPLLSSLHSRFQAEALQPQLSVDHLSIQVVAASTHAKQFITAACIPRLTPLPTPLKVLYTFLQAVTLGKAICGNSQPVTRSERQRMDRYALVNRQVSMRQRK
jgi:hypothetical protein